MAQACKLATWRLGCLDGLRSGFLGAVVLCRSGVRTEFGVNMGSMEEYELPSLVKEEWTGPGWKHSRQKLPRQTVVGLHLWAGDRSHPDQESQTQPFYNFCLLWNLFPQRDFCVNFQAFQHCIPSDQTNFLQVQWDLHCFFYIYRNLELRLGI